MVEGEKSMSNVIQAYNRAGHVNKAVRFSEGWIWFDEFGKDYGPYATKIKAVVLGPQSASNEEILLRAAVCPTCGR